MRALSPIPTVSSKPYGGNPASAASDYDAAFFVHNTDLRVNTKINIAMLKNDSIVPEAYVSPAVKWVNISARKSVMYTSPTTGNLGYGDTPGGIHDMDDPADDYGDL